MTLQKRAGRVLQAAYGGLRTPMWSPLSVRPSTRVGDIA
jgi:hypothetical protein